MRRTALFLGTLALLPAAAGAQSPPASGSSAGSFFGSAPPAAAAPSAGAFPGTAGGTSSDPAAATPGGPIGTPPSGDSAAAASGAARPDDDLDAGPGWLPKTTAQLQALDKVTARVTVITAQVGQPVQFGSLTILARACESRPPEEVPDAAVWMQISDSRRPEAAPVFRGWMFADAPGVNMLEHPVYDLRVLACR